MAETTSPPPARLTGLLYLVIIVAAMIAEAFLRGPLIVSGDAAATAHNILGSELFYRGASALDLLVLFCDTCVALLLYVLLRPAGRNAALLAAFFRLVFVAIMGIDGLLYFAPLTLLQSGAGAFSTGQLQVLAMAALKLQGPATISRWCFSAYIASWWARSSRSRISCRARSAC